MPQSATEEGRDATRVVLQDHDAVHGGELAPAPYGGDEALGFGHGDGTVSGELEGTVTWANYPRRREDGVWTPNLRGVITTRSGEELLLSIHGQSVEEDRPGIGARSSRGSS